MCRAAASAALEQTGGLQLYEDTGFLSENVGPQPALPHVVSSHPLPPAAAAAASPQQGGCLQLYEDTGFLSENVAPQPAAPQAVSSHPAAAPAPLEQTGTLQLYEDTGFLSENVAPEAAVQHAVSSHAAPFGNSAAAAADVGAPAEIAEVRSPPDSQLLTVMATRAWSGNAVYSCI